MGVKGRMWRVIKKMYMSSRSVVLLEGEKSDSFNVDQGVAQGCNLSPILFSVFINDLLKEVEQAELGIQLSSGKTFGGMLFADDFVGVSDSKESLQKLIDVVYSYCSKWRLRANLIKSAVMVFSKDAVNGCWKWGEHSLPKVSSYSYLGIDFSSNGAWDMHIKKLLDIPSVEIVHQEIERGDSSSASFLACVEECISERESRRFEEGLNTKVKLDIYKRFGKSVEFKKYLHGVCDAGSRLLFKFRSGTHGLNEELGRHRGREGKTECSLCGDECENVSHVLWECSAYSSSRACFIKKLQELLEDEYEDFESLDKVEKSSYVLGSELWTKGKLYGSQDSDHAIVHLGLNVSSSAHNCGCMVDGGNAMAAI